MTKTEIATLAERIGKARDVDPLDARAMLRQVGLDHGRDVALAVIAHMRSLSECRYAEAMAVFEGLPSMSFADALRIKSASGDPSAQGWTKQSDGTFSKTTRVHK